MGDRRMRACVCPVLAPALQPVTPGPQMAALSFWRPAIVGWNVAVQCLLLETLVMAIVCVQRKRSSLLCEFFYQLVGRSPRDVSRVLGCECGIRRRGACAAAAAAAAFAGSWYNRCRVHSGGVELAWRGMHARPMRLAGTDDSQAARARAGRERDSFTQPLSGLHRRPGEDGIGGTASRAGWNPVIRGIQTRVRTVYDTSAKAKTTTRSGCFLLFSPLRS